MRILIKRRPKLTIKKKKWWACIPCALRLQNPSIFVGGPIVCTCGRRMIQTKLIYRSRVQVKMRRRPNLMIIPPTPMHPKDKALGIKGRDRHTRKKPSAKCSRCCEHRIIYSCDWDDPNKDVLCYDCGNRTFKKLVQAAIKAKNRPRIRIRRKK